MTRVDLGPHAAPGVTPSAWCTCTDPYPKYPHTVDPYCTLEVAEEAWGAAEAAVVAWLASRKLPPGLCMEMEGAAEFNRDVQRFIDAIESGAHRETDQ